MTWWVVAKLATVIFSTHPEMCSGYQASCVRIARLLSCSESASLCSLSVCVEGCLICREKQIQLDVHNVLFLFRLKFLQHGLSILKSISVLQLVWHWRKKQVYLILCENFAGKRIWSSVRFIYLHNWEVNCAEVVFPPTSDAKMFLSFNLVFNLDKCLHALTCVTRRKETIQCV